jgi:hypothetical protein
MLYPEIITRFPGGATMNSANARGLRHAKPLIPESLGVAMTDIGILRLPHEKSMNLERQGDLGDVPRPGQGTAGSLFDAV